MIITDYNEMSIIDLYIINGCLGIEFEINDGKIVGAINNKEVVGDAE